MRATVREGGRSYPVRRYPSCLSVARPARDRAFYVPRLLLGVGTPRARNSECHSRHSFTSTTRADLHCVVVEEVAATLRTSEIRLGGSLYSMSGDASGKPTPFYKEILRSKDKDVRFTELLIGGKEKIVKK